jgi:hypothetical protein
MTVYLAIFQALSILIAVISLGLVAWLHIRFSHMPGGTVNVRAVLGAIDAVRVQMDSNNEGVDDHFVKIRAKLTDVIDLIDIYVLRVNGKPIPKKTP